MTFAVNTNSPVFEGSNSLKENAGVGDFAGSFTRKTPITGRTWKARLYLDAEAWAVPTAEFLQSLSVGGDGVNPNGVFFKPDGTKMYVIGPEGLDARVLEYDLSTAWDISTATLNQQQNVGGADDDPEGVFFKPDGTKMYVAGNENHLILEYDLSTAWDVDSIGTSSPDRTFDVTGQDDDPSSVFFKPDGTKMYVTGSNNDTVYEYDLSTAWNVTSASFNQSLDVSGTDIFPSGVSFKPDGTRMYIAGGGGNVVYEYSVSTAWDISTASLDTSFDVSGQTTTPQDVFFRDDDGLKMYVCGTTNNDVHEYDLGQNAPSTFLVWGHDTEASLNDGYGVGVRSVDGSFKTQLVRFSGGSPLVIAESTGLPASGEWVEVSVLHEEDGSLTVSVGDVSLSGSDTNLLDADGRYLHHGVGFWSPGGNAGNAVDAWGQELNVIEDWEGDALDFWHGDLGSFSLSEASPVSQPLKSLKPTSDTDAWIFADHWNLSTATFLQSQDLSLDDVTPNGVFFKPDGSKMYTVGSENDNVYEYDLSTPWDVTTAAINQTFDVSGQDTQPEGVFFKPDGLKMYVIGDSNDNVYEYDLSSAWDVSTASFNQSFAVGGGSRDVFFKPDGVKMYVVDDAGDEIEEYDLSTAWDVSTASLNQSLDVSGQSLIPTGVFFRDDGLAMYVADVNDSEIDEYFLATDWDVSTASFNQSFSVSAQDAAPEDVFFRSDGQKMYVIGSGNDSVYEYDLETGGKVRPAPGDTHEVRVWIADEALLDDGELAVWWATNHAAAGLPEDGYGVTIFTGSTLGDGSLTLHKRVDGVNTDLATQNLADNIPRENWLTLRITHLSDGSFTISLHDQSGTRLGTSMTATDTDHITNGAYDQDRVAVRNQLRVNAFDAWIIR